MRIEYHRTLIADKVRNDAFRRALAAVIVPGETVVADIGAGTGLLGLMAARLGAREVYLYERGEVADVARQVLDANPAKNCHLFPCHSTEMRDPPRAHVVVSETLGNHPFEENLIATLNDARRRHLRPGGAVIPASVRQFASPVTSARIARDLTVWDDTGLGIDLSPAKAMSLNNVYVRSLEPSELLDGGAEWDRADFARTNRSTREGEARWTLDRACAVHGFATWWAADLGGGVTLSTAPGAPRTHWEQLYFPLLRPLEGKAGETIAATFHSRSSEAAGTHLAWTGARIGATGRVIERQKLNLDKGWIA